MIVGGEETTNLTPGLGTVINHVVIRTLAPLSPR